MHIRLTVFLLAMVFCLLPDLSTRPAASAATGKSDTYWFFVVAETHVQKKDVETNSDHPEERRWYISSVAALPDDIPDYSAKKKAIEYFDANVVEPAKKRGITVEYYDQDLEINGGSVLGARSRQEAEEMHKKDIEDHKEQGGNIYSFEMVFGRAKGEETSKPKLIHRNKEQPNYEGSNPGK